MESRGGRRSEIGMDVCTCAWRQWQEEANAKIQVGLGFCVSAAAYYTNLRLVGGTVRY